MWLFIVCFILWLAYISVTFRLFLLNPIKSVKYACIDLYKYYKGNLKYYYEGGQLVCYFAHFGGGKTLSMVEYAQWLYKRYNNKRVYDFKRNKWVVQKVLILSNVTIENVSFQFLNSLSQVVECADYNKSIDEKNGTRTITLCVVDEASSQMNSRNFKTNIDASFLNALITCRHYNLSFIYSSQKFKLTDALLRSVTQTCISCHKVWRFMVHEYFDADELELATDSALLKPFKRTGFFITDKLFGSYDTLATVGQLKKSVEQNDMMTEEEILTLRGMLDTDNDAILNPSRKLKKLRRKTK